MKKKLSILHLVDETKIFYKNSIFNMTISSIETFTKMMKLLGHDIFQKDITQYNEMDLTKHDVIHVHNIDNDLFLKRYCPFLYTHNYDNGMDDIDQLVNHSVMTTMPHNIDTNYENKNVLKFTHLVDRDLFYRPKDKYKKDETAKILYIDNEPDGGELILQKMSNETYLDVTFIKPEQISKLQNLFFANFKSDRQSYISEVDPIDDMILKQIIDDHHLVVIPKKEPLKYLNSNILKCLSSGLPVITNYVPEPGFGIVTCDFNYENLTNTTWDVIRNLSRYSDEALNYSNAFDLHQNKYVLEEYYHHFLQFKSQKEFDMKQRLTNSYENTSLQKSNSILVNYEPNPVVHIKGDVEENYNVKILGEHNKNYIFNIKNNHWCAASEKFNMNWNVEVNDSSGTILLKQSNLDLKSKKIYVDIDSTSLGDNIAWMHPAEEMRKKFQCHVTISTFFNDLFEEAYPLINFVEPNTGFNDYDYRFRVGFYEKGENSPVDKKDVSLQEVSSYILGVSDMLETPTNIKIVDYPRVTDKKYVTIAIQSTTMAKYWNYDGGWDTIVKVLKKYDYEVVCVDKHEVFGIEGHQFTTPNDTIKLHERPLNEIISAIDNSEFHIGLGSGLSWVAWALRKPVILISGFSKPYSEFETNCYRVINESVCNGCYNEFEIQKDDWLWCPRHKNTDRAFECTKKITPFMIEEKILKVINSLNAST